MTIERSKIFHESLKYLFPKAISFSIASKVNIKEKPVLILSITFLNY